MWGQLVGIFLEVGFCFCFSACYFVVIVLFCFIFVSMYISCKSANRSSDLEQRGARNIHLQSFLFCLLYSFRRIFPVNRRLESAHHWD